MNKKLLIINSKYSFELKLKNDLNIYKNYSSWVQLLNQELNYFSSEEFEAALFIIIIMLYEYLFINCYIFIKLVYKFQDIYIQIYPRMTDKQ